MLFGTTLYVSNANNGNGSGTVSIVDTTTNTVTHTLAVGDYPWFSSVVGTGLFVSNAYSNSISVIDITTYEVLETIS